MMDILRELAGTTRQVARLGVGEDELIAVTARREYSRPVQDVWDAIADPARVARWLGPISGDLREGGTFQLENNAGGDILECSPPTGLTVTWGGPMSVVRVSLEGAGPATVLVLQHTIPTTFAGSGAGALYVGPGWDTALFALHRWLRGEMTETPADWEASPEALAANAGSIEVWTATITASGTATDSDIADAAATARAQFTP